MLLFFKLGVFWCSRLFSHAINSSLPKLCVKPGKKPVLQNRGEQNLGIEDPLLFFAQAEIPRKHKVECYIFKKQKSQLFAIDIHVIERNRRVHKNIERRQINTAIFILLLRNSSFPEEFFCCFSSKRCTHRDTIQEN